MISRQISTHSSQMYTVGPAMSFLTSLWLLLQKEQRRTSPLPPFFDIQPPGRDKGFSARCRRRLDGSLFPFHDFSTAPAKINVPAVSLFHATEVDPSTTTARTIPAPERRRG